MAVDGRFVLVLIDLPVPRARLLVDDRRGAGRTWAVHHPGRQHVSQQPLQQPLQQQQQQQLLQHRVLPAIRTRSIHHT